MTDLCTDPRAEALLNEYVDGEICADEEPALFAHLAECTGCREAFSTFLAFRMAARSEPLAVPPAADTALFARLDRMRAQPAPNRADDRAPLGGALRRRVSVGAALALAVVAVAVGLTVRPTATAEPTPDRFTHTVLQDGALYLIDPGVTVEATTLAR